jgi:O-antigen/teichoic acid export membrane protein
MTHAPAQTADRVKLVRDGFANCAGHVVTGLAALILVPVLLGGLGAERYGLWIAALSIAAIAGAIDLGLGSVVTREVAASPPDARTREFLSCAFLAYLLFGASGFAAIVACGALLAQMPAFAIAPAVQDQAAALFLIVAIGFAFDQVAVFAAAILGGLGRFADANRLAIGVALARAAALVVAVVLGAGVVEVALVATVASAAGAAAGMAVVARSECRFHLGPAKGSIGLLRAHAGYGTHSMIATAANSAIWELPPLIAGALLGPAAVAWLHAGQKLPIALSAFHRRLSIVFFSAASRDRGEGDARRMRKLIAFGTRGNLLVILPLGVVLEFLAPHFIRLWLGSAPPDVVAVMRIVTGAVMVEALGATALQVHWAADGLRGITRVLVSVALLAGAACIGLLIAFGIEGAAWSVLIAMLAISAALLSRTAGVGGDSVASFLASIFSGLPIPVLACAGTTYALLHLVGAGRWFELVAVGAAGVCAFLAAFLLVGARADERIVARQVLGL